MVIHRFLACVVCLFSFLLTASSQSIEKIPFDPNDSANGYYLAVRPQSGNIKGTLLLLTSFGPPELVLPETRLHSVAYANDLLTIYVSMGKKLYADTAAVNRINKIVKDLQARFSIDPARVALAGFGYSGNIALRYTELANEHAAAYPLHPRAVFAVDTPVDIVGLWHWCERQIRKNYYPGTVEDARIFLDIMTKENGSLSEHPAVYQNLSAFYKDAPANGNEQFLRHTPMRLYYDTDIEWQLANRRNSLYDTDIPDGTELVNRLLLLGNNRAEFIAAKKPGMRSNGLRSPYSLSIVDEVDCIHWIKRSLDIFDPLTWQAPYTFPVPAGWNTERFILPPDFASGFSFKGVEELRFHPGWADPASDGYWTYAYLWWIPAADPVSDTVLQQNFRSYYDGLIGTNIEPRHIPAAKLFPTVANVKAVATLDGDKATFTGTIRMLDYMGQRPMLLHCMIHVKDAGEPGHQAVLVEVSPKEFQHPVWKRLNTIADRFAAAPAPAL